MATPVNAGDGVTSSEFLIADALACGSVQESARRMALTLGFPAAAAEEIALAVAELASNLVKHAGRGTLILRPLLGSSRKGMEVETLDEGPGIPDVEGSFADGYSTAGTLGYGLGTVNRLMDQVDIRSTPGSGTHIACRRWIREDPSPGYESLWDVGVYTRPRRLAPENGDAFVVKHWGSELLIGLIDGLGHGAEAQKAALAAQQYVQSHNSQPLDRIFAGVGRACKATRGVVMALARFKSSDLLSFASIGNIEARVWSGAERLPLLAKRGILGTLETRVHVHEFPWRPGWLLVLHSDGLRTHWQWDDFPGIDKDPAQIAASKLMRALAGENDDATVLAVRGKNP
jgi:anti-sigma regulatory factor (Ser/Thr protein kinase)